jgi:restriction system protein
MVAIVPSFADYMIPIVDALTGLGGSATNQELYERVVDEMQLSEQQLSLLHDPERGGQTEVAYRMAWARTYLKKAGFLTNSERGVWALAAAAREKRVDPNEVVELVRGQYAARRLADDSEPGDSITDAPNTPELVDAEVEDIPTEWTQTLGRALRKISPDAFERLCQRILRESGFVEVRVIGRTGDGGIDGVGILRLQGVVSFHVLFQCKRWQNTVGSKEIRDFRGAMVGRSDKGLFMTTGSFTRGAQEEATRDGAPPIDLIDGTRLAELLKALRLGVRTEMIEKVHVDEAWFEEV